jgi:tetratricopeptide (TPR) repeat protein
MIRHSLVVLTLASTVNAQSPRPDIDVVSSPITARYLAAVQQGAAGKLARARVELDAVLKDEPTHTSARLRLRLLDDAAARRATDVAVTHLFRAALRAADGNHREALAEVDSAIAASPSYDEAFRLRGRTLVDLGEIPRAIEAYNRSLLLNPRNVTALLNRGSAHLRLGSLAAALADFDQAVAHDPTNAEVFVNRGMAHLMGDRHQSAIVDFDRAIALDPGLAPAYNNKALALEQRGDWSAALATYETMVARSRPEHRQLIDHARGRIADLRRTRPR